MIKLFGTTIKETISVFEPVHLGPKSKTKPNDKLIAIVRMIVSFLFLAVGLYLVVKTEHEGLGSVMVGSVIGYWLK